MGKLLDRNREIQARAENLRPLESALRQVLTSGKEEQLLGGRAADGSHFAPISASTARRPRANPRPLVPHGSLSRVITGYRVDFETYTGEPRLVLTAGWPGLEWVGYHRSGTRRMPRRDPGGFRAEDLDRCRQLLRRFVMGGNI